jgi:flagellar basal-body rod protein FlgB
MLKGRLSWLNQRQHVIAENVANADTPGFTPSDLTPYTFQGAMQAQGAGMMAVTSPGHMTPPGMTSSAAQSGARAVEKPDSETKLDGNSVVLEEQMMKMGDARIDYDAAIGFYQQSMNLILAAIKPPGQANSA